MKAPLHGKIAILGTGLIGGSLAAAITKHHVATHVAVCDLSRDNVSYLQLKGWAHSIFTDPIEAVKDAGLVILAVPPSELVSVATVIAPHLTQSCILTDVSSIKRKPTAALLEVLPPHVHFVPGHPIAGSELSGAKAANPDLFSGKRVILTPTEADVLSEPVAQIRNLWEALGANIEYMPADLHDRVYAYVSHLPQIAAYALRPAIGISSNDAACAGAIRLSASNPELWADICFLNADFIHEALDDFATFLSQMQHELSENIQEEVIENKAAATAPALLCAVIALCLVATTLILEQRAGVSASKYGGSGFKDMTAAAGNQSDSVLAAISAHPEAVAVLLENTLDRLAAVGAALSTGNRNALLKSFSAA